MILNNSRERKAYWRYLLQHYATARIDEALQSLPEITARVVRLHHLDGLSFKETAGRLNRSVSTIRHHYNLGMHRLSQVFGNGL